MAKVDDQTRLASLKEMRQRIEAEGLYPGQWLHREIARIETKLHEKAQGR